MMQCSGFATSARVDAMVRSVALLSSAVLMSGCVTNGTSFADTMKEVGAKLGAAAPTPGSASPTGGNALSAPSPSGGSLGQAPLKTFTPATGSGGTSALSASQNKVTALQAGAAQAAGAAGQTNAAQVALVQDKVKTTSLVYDRTCEKVVDAFEFNQNFGELLRASMDMLGTNTATVLDHKVSGQKVYGKGSTAQQLKHNIPQVVRGAAKNMNWLPMAAEKMWGEHQLKRMVEDDQIVPREEAVGAKFYPIADKIVNDLQGGVGQEHPYVWSVHVAASSGTNALALPGGILVIDKGLLDKPKLLDKAYFAVAHEMAHVLQRHQTRALQARIIDTVSATQQLPALLSKMTETRDKPAAVIALLASRKMLFEKHSESQELQSDACAIRLLDSALKDPKRVHAAAASFAASLPSPKPVAPVAPNPLGDLLEFATRPVDQHPSTPERLSNLSLMITVVAKGPGASGIKASIVQQPIPVRANLGTLPR